MLQSHPSPYRSTYHLLRWWLRLYSTTDNLYVRVSEANEVVTQQWLSACMHRSRSTLGVNAVQISFLEYMNSKAFRIEKSKQETETGENIRQAGQ